MNVVIFQRCRNAMQSGRAGLAQWVLECERESRRSPEPLMGWTASGDTLNQVHIEFPTAEQAVKFAQGKGWAYTILPPRQRKVRPRNYTDNFKYVPPEKD